MQFAVFGHVVQVQVRHGWRDALQQQPPPAGALLAMLQPLPARAACTRALLLKQLTPFHFTPCCCCCLLAALCVRLLALLLLLLLQVMRDRETRVSRGYGFVTFANSASAQAAMAQLNGAAIMGPFQGRPLRVSPSNKAR